MMMSCPRLNGVFSFSCSDVALVFQEDEAFPQLVAVNGTVFVLVPHPS